MDGKISAPVLAVLSPLARASQTAKPFLQYAESIGCTIVVLDSARELPGNAAASIKGVKFDKFEWLKGGLQDEGDINWQTMATMAKSWDKERFLKAAGEMGPSLVGNLSALAAAYYTRTGSEYPSTWKQPTSNSSQNHQPSLCLATHARSETATSSTGQLRRTTLRTDFCMARSAFTS